MPVAQRIYTHSSDYELVQVVRILRNSSERGQLIFDTSPLANANLSQVQAIELAGDDVKISVAIEALTGAKSVLPDYFYEQLLVSLHDENNALLDFLNIFNHRYYQLYVAQIERNHLLLREEQECLAGSKKHHFSQRSALHSLAGLVDEDNALLPYTLLLGQKSNSLSALQQILRDYFLLRIDVKPQARSHHWLPINMLWTLGTKTGTNTRLGRGVCLGKRCILQAKAIQITVLPINREEYLQVKADTKLTAALERFIHHYLRELIPIKIFLCVRRRFINAPLLISHSGQSLRLGESNCLAPERNPDVYHNILLQ